MPTAICNNGHVTHWRNTRGSCRPMICRICGQTCHAAQYDPDTGTWSPRRKMKKIELNYRKGSTCTSRNCEFCTHFIERYPIYVAYNRDLPLRFESRCRILGVQPDKRFSVKKGYRCDAQQFDGTDFSKGGARPLWCRSLT